MKEHEAVTMARSEETSLKRHWLYPAQPKFLSFSNQTDWLAECLEAVAAALRYETMQRERDRRDAAKWREHCARLEAAGG